MSTFRAFNNLVSEQLDNLEEYQEIKISGYDFFKIANSALNSLKLNQIGEPSAKMKQSLKQILKNIPEDIRLSVLNRLKIILDNTINNNEINDKFTKFDKLINFLLEEIDIILKDPFPQDKEITKLKKESKEKKDPLNKEIKEKQKKLDKLIKEAKLIGNVLEEKQKNFEERKIKVNTLLKEGTEPKELENEDDKLVDLLRIITKDKEELLEKKKEIEKLEDELRDSSIELTVNQVEETERIEELLNKKSEIGERNIKMKKLSLEEADKMRKEIKEALGPTNNLRNSGDNTIAARLDKVFNGVDKIPMKALESLRSMTDEEKVPIRQLLRESILGIESKPGGGEKNLLMRLFSRGSSLTTGDRFQNLKGINPRLSKFYSLEKDKLTQSTNAQQYKRETSENVKKIRGSLNQFYNP